MNDHQLVFRVEASDDDPDDDLRDLRPTLVGTLEVQHIPELVIETDGDAVQHHLVGINGCALHVGKGILAETNTVSLSAWHTPRSLREIDVVLRLLHRIAKLCTPLAVHDTYRIPAGLDVVVDDSLQAGLGKGIHGVAQAPR